MPAKDKKEAFPHNLCARCIVYKAKKNCLCCVKMNKMQWAHRFIHGVMPNHSRRHRKTEHANVGSLLLFQPFKKNTKLKHLGTVLHVLYPDLQWQLELVTYSFLLLETIGQFFFFLITFILFFPFCNVIFKSILCILNVVFKLRKYDFNNGLHNGLICLIK